MWVSSFEHTREYRYQIWFKSLVPAGNRVQGWFLASEWHAHRHVSVGRLLSFDLILNQVINPVIYNLPGWPWLVIQVGYIDSKHLKTFLKIENQKKKNMNF
jgi:hypothetical protein